MNAACGDGSPFTLDEQDLLSTYTSQADVAIENTRLYTQTDAALTARVEEMSVLQRIDRELNTSLDLDRSMHITLEWAMRQSKSDAGLVGIIEDEESLHLLASQGYTTELHPYQDADASIPKLPLELPTLQEALGSEHYPLPRRYDRRPNLV